MSPLRLPRTTQTDPERGSVAIFVAVLLLALFGFGAYVIDAGAIYAERGDLQDGADSAALALAFDCLANDTVTTCSDTTTTRSQAEFYAESNSHDGEAAILDINFDTADKTVMVRVGTLDATDGNDEIDFVLAPGIGKDSAGFSNEGTASWGTPLELPILPIALSWCDWDAMTNGGDSFSDVAVAISPIPALLAPTCAGPTGPLESGFGYLDPSGDCEADITDGHAQGQTLLALPLPVPVLGCLDISDLVNADRVYVPIFDEMVDVAAPNPPCDTATKPCYRIHGYATFDVDALAPLSLTGHFVDFVALDYFGGIDPDLPDLGLNVIRLSE